jgi:hypothetical protein
VGKSSPISGSRCWSVIAAEIATEHDCKRLSSLVEELNQALADEGIAASFTIGKELGL